MVFYVKNERNNIQMLKFYAFHRIYMRFIALLKKCFHLSRPKSYQLNLIWKK